MACCRTNCACASVIAGLVAGIILGVLYALGFVSTGIIFWAYLALGISGIMLSPIYAAANSFKSDERCFCSNRLLIFTASIGTIITAVIGLIVEAVASVIVVALVFGFATLFAAMLLTSVICLTNCLCRRTN